jgi:hypothetical protein
MTESMFPGASFLYSAFKDVWRAASSRWRGRNVLRAEAFRRWTVDQLCEPIEAIRAFADQDLVEQSDEAHQEADGLWMQLPLDDRLMSEEYRSARTLAEDANTRAKALGAVLRENLEAQLVSGELIARGFREPFSHGAPYLTISRQEWRIIKLDPSNPGGTYVAAAAGSGVAYVGLTIGRPGTKRFLRRR